MLCAGSMWAAYILASKKAGALFSGQDGLAVAFLIGGLVLLPMGGRVVFCKVALRSRRLKRTCLVSHATAK